MNLRIAKKIALSHYGAHVYSAGQRALARRIVFRRHLRRLRARGVAVPPGFIVGR